jgi:cytochrome c1
MRKLIRTALAAAALLGVAGVAQANEGGEALLKPEGGFSWEGVFGHYDKAALKRGWQIYHDVCSNCHSLRLMSYRNLSYLGLTDEEVKTAAAEKEVQDGPNDEGQMFLRPARASDRFVPPFANDKAARAANNGALPPDLTLMTKAREHGPNYVYSLLQGFEDTPPEGAVVPDGMFYNKYFPGHNMGMPPQLMDDLVTYADGTKATKEQEARDIVTFLNWAAEPELDVRKGMGVKVMIFLGVLTALLFALKRQIWKAVH